MGRFRAISRRLTGKPCQEMQATELISKASVDFLNKTRSWRDSEHFVNLFGRFLKNAARDQRRLVYAKKRRGARVDRDVNVITADGAGPVTRIAKGEDERQLQAALDALGPRDRKLVRLRLWESCSWDSIAAQLGFASDNAARMRYGRVLQGLQGKLENLR